MTFILTLTALALVAPPAQAVQPPRALQDLPTLEAADGMPLRQIRGVTWETGRRAPAWKRFLVQEGGVWRSLWDARTGVPLRIFGSGIETPGAVTSAILAEGYAREALEAHVELLAPGADPADFVLVSNDLTNGIRTVGFQQRYDALPVLGGQVSFRFKADRLVVLASEALPWVAADRHGTLVSAARATAAAEAWVRADFRHPTRVRGVSGPVILPLVPHATVRGGLRFAVVRVVDVEAPGVPGRWDVYVDADTGAVVARRQTLRFASGTLRFNAPERWPGATRYDALAAWADVTVDGTALTSDAAGVVTWSSPSPATLTVGAVGTYIQVLNEAGAVATATLSLADGGVATWDANDNEFVDAQITSFIHGNVAKDFARGLDPDLPWLAQQLDINVNIDDTCNAYSDGQTINFYRASQQCENTGRLADVIYHEFAHSMHFYAMLPGAGTFDESLSEGLADTFAASITGDSGMGRGFFKTTQPLREIDPVGEEAVWPDDVGQDSHQTGLIISGAMWDLRKGLETDLGPEEGVAHFLRLYYATMQRSSDIPSAYVEVLAADDDDGDLTNGTPNICLIQRTFAAHGIAGDESMVGGLLVQTPVQDGRAVSVSVQDMGTACDETTVESVVLDWDVRDQPGSGGSLEMLPEGALYRAELPAQDEGVVQRFRVTLTFSDGTLRSYPRNPADRWYETFVGEVFPLYCTDFERDPENDGWTHGLTSGTASEGADDWMWGAPRAPELSGDPLAAYSGEKVFGNDLGGGNFNGTYQASKVNFAASPVVDASGWAVVRLQYRRWLQVEDGYYDQATIYANDHFAWQNADSDQGEASNVHHQDHEWRFHDLDLSPYVNPEGQIQVKFEIASDRGLELGGWTLDDLCVVGWLAPRCGDGRVSAGEECDDGVLNSNQEIDACRMRCVQAHCGDGVVDSDEECDDGNAEDDDGCSSTCAVEQNPKPKQGCHCDAGAGSGPGAPLFLLTLLLGLLWNRRRRR